MLKVAKIPMLPVQPKPVVTWLKAIEPELLLMLLLLAWFILPPLLRDSDPTAGTATDGVWMLILLGFITFLLILALSWWLVKRFWMMMGLPSILKMVSLFKTLTTWQQLSFYWLCYALLLLAAVSCIGSIV